MSRSIPGSTDVHALRLIDQGRIVCDPPTGVILVDGKPRGTSDKHSGYQKIYVAGHYMQSHRVVWLYAHGPIAPGHVINHRDGNKRNNRIENLEAVTPRQNAMHAHRSPNYLGDYPDALAPDLTDVLSELHRNDLDGIEALMQTTHGIEPRHAKRLA
jgi:hypothetical protein